MRYTSRLDDTPGGYIIVAMERIRETNTFHAEWADESAWLRLTSDSQQMGFPLRPTGGGEHEYISRRGGAQAPGSCDRSLATNSKQRRRVVVSYDLRMVTALRRSTAWYMDG